MHSQRFFVWFHRYYIILMGLMACLVGWLNFYARHGFHAIYKHQAYKRTILAGFDPVAGDQYWPTFPMWGYGWLLVLTENKVALLGMQFALGLLSIWLLCHTLKKFQLLGDLELFVFEAFMVLALPWYVLHSFRWPPSILASLLVLAVVLLTVGLKSERRFSAELILSGCCLGLALNFRSDYYLLPLAFASVVWMMQTFRLTALKHVVVWSLCVYLMLVPWILYAKHVTGQYLLTSTNGGLVLFIGFGQAPQNKWGITYSDGDPKVHALLREEFGDEFMERGRGYATTFAEADQFLKRQVFNMILEEPRWFVQHKMAWNFERMMNDGIYAGEFWETQAEPFDEGIERRDSYLIPYQEKGLRQFFQEYGFEVTLRTVLTLFSIALADAPVYAAFWVLPFVALGGILRRDIFSMLVVVAVTYRILLSAAAVTQPQYTAHVYVFYVLSLALALHHTRSLLTLAFHAVSSSLKQRRKDEDTAENCIEREPA